MNDRQTPAESRSSGPSFDFASLPNILGTLPGEVSHSFVRQFAGTPMSPRHRIAFTWSSLRLHFVFTSSSLDSDGATRAPKQEACDDVGNSDPAVSSNPCC